jgi:heptosyltransferase-2
MCRPGIDDLLEGSSLVDELHVARASGIMGPKFAAAKVRPRRYDTALLLTNSFSTALTVRIAGIPRRIGYDRDARGLLLTDRMDAPRRADGSWAAIPAVEYYWNLAERFLLGPAGYAAPRGCMVLGISPSQREAGRAVLERGGVAPGAAYAVLNPGANDAAKRWPTERFAAVADHLAGRHGFTVLINGSPGEADLAREIAGACRVARPVRLPEIGITLGSLKAVVSGARVLVTNDTGPRHIAAALGVPLVSLFGPTDYRWAPIPTRPGAPEEVIVADPTLPAEEYANDHPERCRMDRIGVERVVAGVDRVLGVMEGGRAGE